MMGHLYAGYSADFIRQLAEWMACLIFILPFKKRFSPAVTGCLVAGAFGIQSVFLISTGGVRLIFWIPCMIFAVFLMVAFVFCCCEGLG